MNWYKKAQTEESYELEELLNWMSGSQVVTAQIRRGLGRQSTLTPEQQDIIKTRYEQGLNQTEIAKGIGTSTTTVRKYLLKSGLLKPQGNLHSDENLVNNVKTLRRTINENTGKLYNVSEMSRELGVSRQTIERTIGFYDPQTPKELASYVSYMFWSKYGGMKKKIDSIRPEERINFISNFIDGLFKDPKNKASAKETIFQKLKIRNNMLGNPDPPTQLMESRYKPDFEDEEALVRRKVKEPTDSGVWDNLQRQRTRNPQKVSKKYDQDKIAIILQEYAQNGYKNYQKLALKHGISMSNLREILVEEGLPINSQQRAYYYKDMGIPNPQQPKKQPTPQQQQQIILRQQMKSLGDWYVQQDALKARPERELNEEYHRRREELNLQYA